MLFILEVANYVVDERKLKSFLSITGFILGTISGLNYDCFSCYIKVALNHSIIVICVCRNNKKSD